MAQTDTGAKKTQTLALTNLQKDAILTFERKQACEIPTNIPQI
jgi:hypothetical protein